MIIKSQIWVAKYFTQGKCEEAVSEEKKNLLSRTHRTSSQEDADNQYCFTAKALQVTYSGKWINPNHPLKCSQILQMVRVEVDVFWGAVHFFVHTDSWCPQCRVWGHPQPFPPCLQKMGLVTSGGIHLTWCQRSTRQVSVLEWVS